MDCWRPESRGGEVKDVGNCCAVDFEDFLCGGPDERSNSASRSASTPALSKADLE